ncbi:MAG: hypothetical protein ACR65X_10295 [Methylocystis sp.]
MIYEELHPETKHGENQHTRSRQVGDSSDRFTSDTAAKTGQSERQLDESQRVMVAARLANIRHGGDRKSDQAANLPLEAPIQQLSQAQAAQLTNVGERSVRSARKVIESGVRAAARELGVDRYFPSPFSTSRRMASGRDGRGSGCAAIQASMAFRAGLSRRTLTASLSTGGRPRLDLLAPDIDMKTL